MKTINTCSIFTEEVEQILIENKITNGLGGEGDNIEIYIKGAISIIEDLKIYEPAKAHQLYKDIYRLHFLHDIMYSVGKSKLEFYFANYIFVRDLYKLLKWTGFLKSLGISLTVFIILNKYGKNYYNK